MSRRRPASWLATLKRDDLALMTNITSAKIHIGRLSRNKVDDEAIRGVKPLTLDQLHAWSGLWNALPLCNASGGRGKATYYWEPHYAHGAEADLDERCKACFAKWRGMGSPTVRGWTDRKEAGDWPLPFAWKEMPTIGHPWDVSPGVSLDSVRDNKGEIVGEPRQELHRWQRGARVVRIVQYYEGVEEPSKIEAGTYGIRHHHINWPLKEDGGIASTLPVAIEKAWRLMARGGRP
jgi:hypothetical protein